MHTSLPASPPIEVGRSSDSHSLLLRQQICPSYLPSSTTPVTHFLLHESNKNLAISRALVSYQHALQYSPKITVTAFVGHPVAKRLPSSPPFHLKTLPRYRITTVTTNEESKAIAYLNIILTYLTSKSTSINSANIPQSRLLR